MKPDKAIVAEYYAQRDRDGQYEEDWGYRNPAAAAYWRARDELILDNIGSYLNNPQEPRRVLEVGCGHGHELSKFALFGIRQSSLVGIDLIANRLLEARGVYPSLVLSQQDGTNLAFASESFDIVCQFTCIMHILSKEAQTQACREMLRVLRPNGLLIWWDVSAPRWRVILLQRLCQVATRGNRARKTIRFLNNLLRELVSTAIRSKALHHSIASYMLPISQQDIIRMFPTEDVFVRIAGLDYTVWKALWRHAKPLADMLWRSGWFGQHCFAVIQKK